MQHISAPAVDQGMLCKNNSKLPKPGIMVDDFFDTFFGT